MSFVPFDHPYLSALLGDESIAAFFSADADLAAMSRFELALSEAEAEYGVIERAAAQAIAQGLGQFQPDYSRLKQGTARDGVVIPELLRQMRQTIAAEFQSALHYGATSQDAIDTSLMLRLKSATAEIASRLAALILAIETLEARFGADNLMGHTRMQAAIPIKTRDRLASWKQPLQRIEQDLGAIATEGFPLQFGGAAGTLEKLGEKGAAVRADLAKRLGLKDLPQWQSQRDIILRIAGILATLSGTLGKIGQDVALLAQAGGDITIAGGGGSSAMPHKQNPVAAEILVTLARFNAVAISGLHHSMVHEQERSGQAWTLEWLLLPQITVATGAALNHALVLTSNITKLGQSDILD